MEQAVSKIKVVNLNALRRQTEFPTCLNGNLNRKQKRRRRSHCRRITTYFDWPVKTRRQSTKIFPLLFKFDDNLAVMTFDG